jgi:pimeloyl-ACP methyl ester carboxylesterase
LILESVLGRAAKNGEGLQNLNTAWAQVRARLSAPAVATLSAPVLPFADAMPAGEARVRWGNFIKGKLYYGFYPSTTYPDLPHQLQAIDGGNTDALKTAVVASVPVGYWDIFRTINCREIDQMQYDKIALEGGALVKADDGLCGDLHFTTPYDSASEKITMPIVYFTGTVDSVTPVFQARYHFDNHPDADRTLIVVPNAAHESFALQLGQCHAQMWQALFGQASSLKQTLGSCQGVVSVSEDAESAAARTLTVNWQ